MTDVSSLTLAVDSTSVRTADKDLDEFAASAQKADTATDGLKGATDALTPSMNRTAASVKATTAATQKATVQTGRFKGATQQLGFQVQDIAVQLQGGTAAAQVFGQQGSQIAGIFGPGGAVIGALIAVGAALATAFTGGTKAATQDLNELKDRLAEVGLEFNELGRSAQEAFRAQFLTDLVAAQTSLREMKDEQRELNEAFRTGDFSKIGSLLNRAFGNNADRVAAAGERVRELAVEIDLTTAQVDALELALKQVGEGTFTFDPQAVLTATRDVVGELIEGLREQAATMSMSTAEAAAYSASLRGATQEQQALISALVTEIELQKQAELAERNRAKGIEALFAKVQSPETLEAQFKADLAVLQTATEEELALLGGHAAAKLALEQWYTSQLVAEEKKRADAAANAQRQKFDAFVGATTATIGLLAQLSSAEDANSKKSFERTKFLRSSEAFVNGAAAFVVALADEEAPAAARWANAFASTAAAATQIAAINSAQYGGGGSAAAPTPPPPSQTTNNVSTVNNATINVTGGAGAVEELRQFFNRDGILITEDTAQGRRFGR